VVPFCDAMSCSTDCILAKGCPTNDPSVLDSSARPRSDRVREFADNTSASSSNSKPPSNELNDYEWCVINPMLPQSTTGAS
jgi:hypothetical protein